VLVAEHHFSNYGMSPAAAAGARHRRAYETHPNRDRGARPAGVAAAAAGGGGPSSITSTGGRFICGIGRGYQPHEIEPLDVTLDESRVRFNETLDVLIRA
jgi:alkanesulfonate monooxygenase SsuD/methylene tetrahydromethanopterin reductase-like flavin-dependent oxidoreductase (luciferase family)